jgi:chitosanase
MVRDMRTRAWLTASTTAAILAGVLAVPMTSANAATPDAGGYDAYTYTGTWGTNNVDEKYSATAGATATATFDVLAGGSKVQVWGNTDQNSGKAGVSIDGGTATTVDTYDPSAPPGIDRNWYASPLLAEGRHTLKINVLGQKQTASGGAWVSVEGINGENIKIVWPGSTPAAAPSSTDLSKFTSSGTWDKTGGNTKWFSNSTGAYVTVPVTIAAGGGTVTIKGTKADNYGFGAFSVDGGAETKVDLYAVTRVEGTSIWTSGQLTAGQHTVKVRVDGTKRTAATDRYVAVAGASTTNGTFGTSTTTPTTPPPATSPLDDPVVKEKALQITSTAENSTKDWTTAYPYIEDIKDGRGYTAGIVGWCSGTGDMLELIKRYNTASPNNGLTKFTDELTTIMTYPYDQRPAKSHELLDGQGFVAAWKAEAGKATFQKAQRDERDKVYYIPALDQAKKDGVGPLGLAELYDISVNHGPGTDSESFGGIVAAAAAASPPPSKGGSEAGYLKALNDKRRAVLASWGDDQPDGRDEAFAELINAGEFQLAVPVTWHMYGEVFSWTTDPQ